MTDSPQPSRPPQVTTAAVLAVAASVLAVVNLFTTRDQLRTSTVRDALSEQRGPGPFAQGGGALDVLEVLVLVSGALAATSGVLAVFAWLGNRAAWLGFFVVAGLLTLTWQVAGLMPLLLLASGATFFATRPVRDWFADRAPLATGPQVAFAQQRPLDGPWHGGAAEHEGQPEPRPGQPSGWAGAPAAGQGYPSGYGQPAPPGSGDPDKRPGTVTAACVITWVGSTLVGALTALVALVLLADRASFVREFQRQADTADLQVSESQVVAAAWTVAVVGVLWCLLAAVLAVLAFRRSRGGRVGLAVSAALTVLVSLVAVLSIVALVPLLLGVAVLILLFTGGANEWYARRGGGSPSGPPATQGQPPFGQPPTYGQAPPPPSGHQGPW